MTAKRNNSYQEYETTSQSIPRFNRVILLDDNDIDLEIESTLLKGLNLAKQIDKRMKAESVLNELRSLKRLDEVPDLIFLDLQMPDMSGYDFLVAFNTMPEFVKKNCSIIIVSSAKKEDDINRTYMFPNVIKYVSKPIDVKDVREIITMPA